MRALKVFLGLLVLGASLAPIAAGQTPSCAKVTVAATPNPVVVPRDGGEGTVNFVFSNVAPNPPLPGGEARLRIVVTAATGWSVTVDPSELVVASGQNRTVNVRVTAPEDARPDDEARLALSATGSCTYPGGPATPLALPPINAEARAVVETPPSAFGLPSDLLPIGGVLIALGVVATGAALVLRRRPGALISSAPEPEKPVRAGRGASFPITVSNRGRDRDTASCSVGPAPEGWSAFMTTPEVEVGPGETRTLYLMVRAPAGAPEGTEAAIRVSVASRASRLESGLEVRAKVVEDRGEAEAEPAT